MGWACMAASWTGLVLFNGDVLVSGRILRRIGLYFVHIQSTAAKDKIRCKFIYPLGKNSG